tara:strand:- start:326 stop:502 length:177 start_codon:yes stop_codon:yes gene_type:complete
MRYFVTYRRKCYESEILEGFCDLLRADFTNERGAMLFMDFLEDQNDVIQSSISLYERD